MRDADLITEVKFLKRDVKHAGNKAKGQGVQASFKVFRQLMLQLHPNFDMGALKALVTLEVVEEAVIEVKEAVVTAGRVAPKASNTSEGEVGVETGASVGVPDVIEIKDTDES